MRMELPENTKSRRHFLKYFFSTGAGFISSLNGKTKNADVIKMLTPDGKLVEIEKSKFN